MLISWQTRLRDSPHLRNINNWPHMDIGALPRDRKTTFLRNKAIVSHVLKGEKCNAVALKFGLSRSSISLILKRCLGGNAQDNPALTRALIPQSNLKPRTRLQAIPTLTKISGPSCCFTKLLNDVPQITSNIDALINADLNDNSRGQNVTIQIAFDEYKRTLKEVNWPQDAYPYTTQSLGYYSLRHYVKKRIQELLTQKTRQRTQDEISILRAYSKALQNIEIDEQIVDVNCAITLNLDDTLIPLRLSRISLLLAIDSTTDCILGYHIAYTKSPNQQDMLSLFRSMFYSSELRSLNTAYLTAPPGNLFPSQGDDMFKHLSVGTIKLDNALFHKATSVTNFICDYLGATLNLGLPKRPNARNWVEYAFKRINKLSHRFKSTTGSHPNDAIKESAKNAKSPPPLALETFEDALYIALGTHNITPQARLGNSTPLAALTHQLENSYVRLHPTPHDNENCPHFDRQDRSVILLHSENRAPFINFEGVRYTGKCLYDAINRKVEIRFNRTDIRVLQVFDKSGFYLGKISAPKTWMRFPHSIHTRKTLLKFNRMNKFHCADPFANYFSHLLKEKESPKTALEIFRVFNELSSDTPNPNHDVTIESDVKHKTVITKDSQRKSVSKKKVSAWNTHWANTGGPPNEANI